MLFTNKGTYYFRETESQKVLFKHKLKINGDKAYDNFVQRSVEKLNNQGYLYECYDRHGLHNSAYIRSIHEDKTCSVEGNNKKEKPYL